MPEPSTCTPRGALSDTAVAEPANVHAVLAPVPANSEMLPPLILRMQLFPVSDTYTLPDESTVTGEAAELYAHDLATLGYVPSHTRATALNPEAVRAFESLIKAVAPGLGMRRYELVTLAAAGALEPYRAEGIHSAMMVIPIINVVLTVCMIAAAITVAKDLEKLQTWMREAVAKASGKPEEAPAAAAE